MMIPPLDPSPSPREWPAEVHQQVLAHYDQGQYCSAYALVQPYGAFNQLQGNQTCILAGRLADRLGGIRLRATLHLKNWRANPTDPEAIYYYVSTILSRQGSLAAWRLTQQFGTSLHTSFPQTTDLQEAHWLALQASILATVRDFDRANALIHQARTIAPPDPWLWVETANLLRHQDQYDQALATAQQALTLQPFFQPAVRTCAHVMTLLGQEQAALALLSAASQSLECSTVLAQLATLQMELGQYPSAYQNFAKAPQMAPLLEDSGHHWLTANCADAAYQAGFLDAAKDHAQTLLDKPGFQTFATRLSQLPPVGQRVILPVGFVRQHHMTCAPATLTALCRYWSKPAEHLEIAEAICYDGTSHFNERRWAEAQGWAVREFRLTWESAQALIDQGIPFTLTTVEPTSAHLQAVIGYDSFLDTLILRDPYERQLQEVNAKNFLERYQASGPRAMAIAPPEQAQTLAAISLPDCELYDQLYVLQGHLETHQRAEAEQIRQAIATRDLEHRLSIEADYVLASYDGDQNRLLEANERLLQLFPDSLPLCVRKVAFLEELARQEDRLDLLKQLSSQVHTHPVFWQLYAQALSQDARNFDQVSILLERAIRALPTDAQSYQTLAEVYWTERRFDEAFELFRFATCLADKSLSYARSYFLAARALGKTEVVLDLLTQRLARDGHRSSQPARLLAWVYDRLDRPVELFRVLELAQTQHPEDGALLLHRATQSANYGRHQLAQTLLRQAIGKVPGNDWLESAAVIDQRQGNLAQALARWQQVAQAEPLSIVAHQAITELLAELEGPESVHQFLETACQRSPYSIALQEIRYNWVKEHQPEQAIAVLQDMIALNPDNAWTHRQLAWQWAGQNSLSEAFAALATAQQLEPQNPAYHGIYGHLCALNQQILAAKQALRQAIALSVDSEWAIHRLLSLCESLPEKREELAFIYQELTTQVIDGNGFLSYWEEAKSVLAATELLPLLQAGLAARPDLWQSWSVVVQQLVSMQELDSALAIAQQATATFPLLPKIWLDLATVYAARQDFEAEVQALESALEINPGWREAILQLASTYDRLRNFARSCELLQKALIHLPNDAVIHGYWAESLWQAGNRPQALQVLQQAIHLELNYPWAWEKLQTWSQILAQPELPEQWTRELLTQYPTKAVVWYQLAKLLNLPEQWSARLEALNQAIALNPKYLEAYRLKIETLAALEQYEDAIALCRPPVEESNAGENWPPLDLRICQAWVYKEQGNLPKAIQFLNGLLAEYPTYLQGWSLLTEYSRRANDRDNYHQAATQYTQLDPTNSLAWEYLGHVTELLGDRTTAAQIHQHTLTLDPTNRFAGLSLFDLQLENNELEAAAQTLAGVGEGDDEYIIARQVQLAAQHQDPIAACQGLQILCGRAIENEWPLETAVQAVSTHWLDRAQIILEEALQNPKRHSHVDRYWVLCCIAQGRWNQAQGYLLMLPVQDRRGEVAHGAFIQKVVSASGSSRLNRYVSLMQDPLRQNVQLWGLVGWAYNQLHTHDSVVLWFYDWQTYANAEPWMLLPLARSLRTLKQDRTAHNVSTAALKLPEDPATIDHRLWLLYDLALKGQGHQGEAFIQSLAPENLGTEQQFIYHLARAMTKAQSPGATTLRFQQAKGHIEQLKQMVSPEVSLTGLESRVLRQGLWQIAKCNPSLPNFLWIYWQCVWLTRDEVNLEKVIFGFLLVLGGLLLLMVIGILFPELFV